MVDTQNQPPLPPGCRFYPSEEQLLSYYLTNKNKNNNSDTNTNTNTNGEDSNLYDHDVIKELDLSDFKPYELPESACYAYGQRGGKRHWYCYGVRVLSERRRRMMVKGGYWRKGSVKNVMSRIGRVLLGTRTRFVFYLGNSPKNSVKTDWIMYEYSLGQYAEASFVLCRVFVKSHGETSASDNVLTSCAEEGVSAAHHIGMQHDGFLTPDVVEADISRYSMSVVIELDDQVIPGPISVAIPLVGTFGLTGAGRHAEDVTASIVEEDFIELDDLLH